MKIQIKRSTVKGKAPKNGTLITGELAVNLVDGKIFVGDENNNAIELGKSTAIPERGGTAFDDTKAYTKGDIVSVDHIAYIANTDIKAGSFYASDWVETTSSEIVTSKTSGKETRIAEIVQMTQADYDALGTKQSDKLYIIVG